MASRYTNSIGWEFRGDIKTAKQYIPLARKIVGFEMEQAVRTKSKYRSIAKEFDNGLKISATAILWLGQPNIVRCVIDVRRLIGETVQIWLDGLSHPLVNNLQVGQPHYANDNGDPALNRFFPKGGDLAGSPAAGWVQESRLATAAVNIHDKIPGKYSGEMRKVVQSINAQNERVPYDYTWIKCHGVFTSAITGNKWVIQIESNATIKAWPLNTVPPDEEDGEVRSLNGLDYRPVGGDPALVVPEDALTLSTSGAITEAFQYTPFFPECGWAFSASGRKACNVTYSTEQGAPNYPTFDYFYTRQFELTINEDGEGVPTSVSAAIVDQDWLYGYRCIDGIGFTTGCTQIKFPLYQSGTLYSFDWLTELASPPADDYTPPVYCWYDGEQLQTVHFHHDTGISSSSNESFVNNPCASGGPAARWGNNTSITDAEYCFTSPAFPSAFKNSSMTGSSGSWQIINSFSGAVLGATELNASSYMGATEVGTVTRYGVEDSTSVMDVIIVPFNEREGIFHLRQEVEITKSSSTSRGGGRIVAGGLWGSTESVSNATQVTRSISGSGEHGDVFPDNFTYRKCWGTPAPDSCSTNTGSGAGVTNLIALLSDEVRVPQGDFTADNYWNYPETATGTDRYVSSASEFRSKVIDLTSLVEGLDPEDPCYNVKANIIVGGDYLISGDPECGTGRYGADYRSYNVNQTPPVGDCYEDPSSLFVTGNGRIHEIEPTFVPQLPPSSGAEENISQQDDAKLVVGGAVTNIDLEPSANPGTTVAIAWGRWISDLDSQWQQMLVCADASDTIDPIYTFQPTPDYGLLGVTYKGPASYPFDEASNEFISWVGNPGDIPE